MASKQVLKLCKKIENDCGVVCKPETFHTIRDSQSFWRWYMDVDIDNSTGFSKRALECLGYTTCGSSCYVKDLLKQEKLTKRVDIDASDVIIM